MRLVPRISLAAALLLVGALPGWAAPAAAVPSQQAFVELAGCVASGRPLYTKFVVDESRSLEQTDPGAARRVALRGAIDLLADLARQSGTTVRASLSTFADAYTTRIPWAELSGAHLLRLRHFADHEVAQLRGGTATNYRTALSAASADLASAAGARPACQAVLWFTDGGLDVDRGEAANRAAYDDICQRNGIADSLRRHGVHLLAFGLLARQGAGSVTAADRDRLRAIAEGTGGAARCGTHPLAPTSAAGAYLPADQADRLRGLFESATARIGGYTPDAAVACPGEQCAGGLLRIPVDPGIRYARLVVVPEGAVTLALTGPHRSILSLPTAGQRAGRVDGADVTARASVGVTRADLDLRVPSAHGEWSLAVRGKAGQGRATVEVYRSSGLQIRLVPAALTATAGQPLRYTAQVVDRQGTPADPRSWRRFDLRAKVGTQAAVPLIRSSEGWTGTVEVARSGFPLSLPLNLTLDLVTKGNALALTPVALNTTVRIRPPASVPSVTPQELILPAVVGDGATRGVLTLTGSDQGSTQVCFGTPAFRAPAAVRQVDATPPLPCVRLAPNERKTIAMSIDPQGSADGLVEGVIPVTLRGAHAGDQSTVEIPVRFGMHRVVDQGVRWSVAALLMCGAMLLPLVVLWLVGRRVARFRYEVMKTASIGVLLTPDGPTRRIGRGAPVELAPQDFRYRPPPTGETRYHLDDTVVLRARARARTLFRPEAVAEPLDRTAGVAGAHDEAPIRLGQCAVELGASSLWLVVVEDTGALATADLHADDWSVPARLVVMRTTDGPESLADVNRSLAGFSRWSPLVDHLSRLAAAQQPVSQRSSPVDPQAGRLPDTPTFIDGGAPASRADTPSRGEGNPGAYSDSSPPDFL
jgi:hypothetical protein